MVIEGAGIQHAVQHQRALSIHSREEAKGNTVPARLPRQLSPFLREAPPGQPAMACWIWRNFTSQGTTGFLGRLSSHQLCKYQHIRRAGRFCCPAGQR